MRLLSYIRPSAADTQTHIPVERVNGMLPECWSCHHPYSHTCGPDDMRAGDIILCLNCTAISIAAGPGRLREPNPMELANLSLNEEVRAFQQLMQAANRRARQKE